MTVSPVFVELDGRSIPLGVRLFGRLQTEAVAAARENGKSAHWNFRTLLRAHLKGGAR